MSVAHLVSRLTSPAVRSALIPLFVAGTSVVESGWDEWAASTPPQSLKDFLASRIGTSSHDTGFAEASRSSRQGQPKVIIFGEQHHQPKVLSAQLQLIHILATEPFNLKVTVVMEHFNIIQQSLLDDFARTGEAESLQAEYAKSSEGFHLDNTGYLPLLNLARELENVNSTIVAGFPPRQWARIVMRQGKEGLAQDEEVSQSGLLNSFDRWEDLTVSTEHAAYISSSIGASKPALPSEVQQGGLKAAQAFKDAVMAFTIDKQLEKSASLDRAASSDEVIVAICGSGHCEYDFGITERIRNCSREDILLLVCKPEDGTFWRRGENDGKEERDGRKLADAIIIYEAIDV